MSQWQLTSGLDDGLYLRIFPPISDLAPGSAEKWKKSVPMGGTPLNLPPVQLTPHLTLT